MIREDQAAQALGLLVGGTQGWNDEAVAVYLSQLVQVDDADALHRACLHILKTHADPGRPSMARILDRYRYEYGQRPAAATSRQIGARHLAIMPVEEGLRVAWDAYVDECQKQGKQPNKPMFAGWARRVGA